MATGLPIVATRVGGNPELVTPGENGLLVPPADADALAAALLELLRSERQRQAMGEASLNRVRRDFHWERTVARYLEVYDRLLGKEHRMNRETEGA
jgi:glycosyltransferase involved in cell wall biosynthesis